MDWTVFGVPVWMLIVAVIFCFSWFAINRHRLYKNQKWINEQLKTELDQYRQLRVLANETDDGLDYSEFLKIALEMQNTISNARLVIPANADDLVNVKEFTRCINDYRSKYLAKAKQLNLAGFEKIINSQFDGLIEEVHNSL